MSHPVPTEEYNNEEEKSEPDLKDEIESVETDGESFIVFNFKD